MNESNRHTCDLRPVWVPEELPCKECETDNRQKEAMGIFRDPKWLGKKTVDECLVSDPPTARGVVSWCHGDPSDAFIVSGVQRMLDLYARGAVLADRLERLNLGEATPTILKQENSNNWPKPKPNWLHDIDEKAGL